MKGWTYPGLVCWGQGGALSGAPEHGCWLGPEGPSWDCARSLQETGSYQDEKYTNIFPSFPFRLQMIWPWTDFFKMKDEKTSHYYISFFLKPHHNWPQLMFFRSHPSSLIMFCLLSTELSPATSHLTYWSQAMKKDLAKATWNIQPHNTQTNILTLHMLRLTIHLSLFSLFPIDLLDW